MEHTSVFTGPKQPILPKLQHCIKKAKNIYFVVSFIRDSGAKLITKSLEEAKEDGKEIKIITSNYLNVTEPNALYRLSNTLNDIKIFDNNKKNAISFHPKTYIFEYEDGDGEVLIGSSNLSHSALLKGVEWNFAFKKSENKDEFQKFLDEFNELYTQNSFDMTLEWLRKYEKTYVKNRDIIDVIPQEDIIEPIKFQIPALYELSKTREEGYNKAMVIVATGLGKTYLSAFDTLNFKKVLFIAHRDEILRQSMDTFTTVHKNKTMGFFNAKTKDIDSDIIFASVQTLGKEAYLTEDYFNRDYFDYIVVDEFHHADAPTYRRIIDYFEPKFLLGLTATPDRMDSGDIYEICDYNIAYECNFKTGINNGWLVPYDYYGIYDNTDYESIPWRSGKYDMDELENRLTVSERCEDIYSRYLLYKKNKTIGFCASKKHAEFMTKFFRKKKINCEFIVGDTPYSERQKIIENFKGDNLSLIFVVDIFNEGVDIPYIDTLMFLRPTNSYTIFIQQLGRGLRTMKGKDSLRVIDFVGNYKGSQWKPLFLSGNYDPRNTKIKEISPLDKENFKLPNGCSANFDMKLIEHFASEKKKTEPLKIKLLNEFENVEEFIGTRPNILDINSHGKYPVNIYIKTYKSWLNFLVETGKANPSEKLQWENEVEKNFLMFLEKTSMTKSYKIPLLETFINDDKFSQTISTSDVAVRFKDFYSNTLHGRDLNNKKHLNWETWKLKDFEKLAVENPIHFLSKSGNEFFEYNKEEKLFFLKEDVYNRLNTNKNIIYEIKSRLEYRNITYFKRKYGEDI